MAERAKWDAEDPFDAMAESFRIQVVDILLDAGKVAIFHDLDNGRKIEAFLCGAMTGMVGCALASMRPDGHDEVMKFIADYLPLARANAEEIAASSEAS